MQALLRATGLNLTVRARCGGLPKSLRAGPLHVMLLVGLCASIGAQSDVLDMSTLAGTGTAGSTDGPGSVACFYGPSGVAVHRSGYLYVADTQNHTIRRVTRDGVVSTLAGAPGKPGRENGPGHLARFCFPHGVAVDAAGNVFVADWCDTIRKITPDGVVSLLAGGETGSRDGFGPEAQFYEPEGLAVDNAGNVFVADKRNHSIRKVSPFGLVTTVAGYSGNRGCFVCWSPESNSSFCNPTGVAVDSTGNLFVADHRCAIKQVTPDGLVSVLAGGVCDCGGADGPGEYAKFSYPGGVAVDTYGNVYVADTGDNTIRRITAEGMVSTLAGRYRETNYVNGPGKLARFWYPYAVAVDGAGNVFVADTGNHVIRKGVPDSGVRAFDGTEIIRFAPDPPGKPTSSIRISVKGVSHGVALTEVDAAEASKFRIQTPAGVKALKKLP